jgi:hypothetical protein
LLFAISLLRRPVASLPSIFARAIRRVTEWEDILIKARETQIFAWL